MIHISQKRIVVWMAAFLLSACWISAQGEPSSLSREIHNSAELNALGNQAAKSGPPVHVLAQVTYVDMKWRMLFLHDVTGSLYVTIDRHTLHLQQGDIVDIRGRAAPGAVSPIILDPKIRIRGQKQVPAPTKTSLASLDSGSFDGQFVLTEGILRPGPVEWDHVNYWLVDGKHIVSVTIPSTTTAPLANLVGAKVVVRGVKGARTDAQFHVVASILWVQSPSDVTLGENEWHGPFALPVSPIGQIQPLANEIRFNHPVHVKGTLVWKGTRGVVVENSTSLIYADLAEHFDVAAGPAEHFDAPLGSEVEIVGYPEVHDGVVELRKNVIRKTESKVSNLGASREISPSTPWLSSYAGRSVRISGRLVAQSTIGEDYLFTLDRNGVPIKVLIPGIAPKEQFPAISPGTEVECRGVLWLQPQKVGPPQIEILVGAPSDLLVKTGLRINWKLFIAILSLLAALGVVLWIVQLRHALRAKTIQIRSQLEHEVQIESRYRRLFERNFAGVFTWSPTGEILDCNPAFARMLGYEDPATVIGKSYLSCNVDLDSCSLEAIRDRGMRAQEMRVKRADGTLVYLLEHTTHVDSAGAPYFETMALDISESRRDKIALQNARDAACRESLRDPLTGLPNRRYFARAVKEELNAADNATSAIAVLYIDLNGFKAVNDTMGHPVGDQVLCQVASRLVSALGSTKGTICRIGGDEFAAILRYCGATQSPVEMAELLQASLTQPFDASGTPVAVGASIGISTYPLTASDDTTLLQQADTAMYIAKRSDVDMIVVYTPEIGRELQEQNLLLSELKMAVLRGEIYLEYQPEYEVQTGRLMRFEALARWTNPALGNVPPCKFIPIAEESGLMINIGAHILEMACRDACAWNVANGRRIPVAVNVSSIQLRSESFVESVLEITRRTGLDPTLLELEMTESITVGARELAVGMLMKLRNAGVKLALDDFGTGYSCLSYLGDLPFDRLKVDRSFLRKADLGRGVPALMNAVLSVAHALSMVVVVEGIETAEELEFVSRMGADEVQGFLLGRPSTDPQRVITDEAVFARPFLTPALPDKQRPDKQRVA